MKRLLTTLLFVTMVAISYHASAATATYTLTGGQDCDNFANCWDGVPGTAPDYLDVNNNFDAADISAITGAGVLYETFKDNSPYDGSLVFDIGHDASFFYIKDGSNDPNWYIYDVSNLSPNTRDGTITLEGIWFGKSVEYNGEVFVEGPISHVSAFGPSAVPIPAAAWLMGSGLLGLVGVARRKTTA